MRAKFFSKAICKIKRITIPIRKNRQLRHTRNKFRTSKLMKSKRTITKSQDSLKSPRNTAKTCKVTTTFAESLSSRLLSFRRRATRQLLMLVLTSSYANKSLESRALIYKKP